MSASSRETRSMICAVFLVFFMNSIVLGNWIPRIPDVKNLFELSSSELGIALFCIAGGTLIAFAFAGAIVEKLGLRGSCILGMPLWAAFIAIAPLMPGFAGLCVMLVFAGMSVGLLEVGMNTAAEEVARRSEKEIMSRAHGFWSLGSLAGAVTGAAFANWGIDVRTHFIAVLPLAGLLGIIVSLKLPVRFTGHEAGDDAGFFQLPHRAILLLCLMPVGIMLVEGAFIDWSALFVQSVLAGGAVATGAIYAAFSTVMAATRLSGDWLVERFGPLRVAQVSAASATIGIVIFATSSDVAMAFVGALFSGLGVAIVYPLAMTAAARRPGQAATNVAALSFTAFSAFMFAPPIVGFVADFTNLRIALLMLAPIAAMSYFLSAELIKGKAP